eukprot:Sspe_Gene.3557::Locus_1179_Transcript_2_2_Confidence_0.667_Length_1734::g.3557::m.3557
MSILGGYPHPSNKYFPIPHLSPQGRCGFPDGLVNSPFSHIPGCHTPFTSMNEDDAPDHVHSSNSFARAWTIFPSPFARTATFAVCSTSLHPNLISCAFPSPSWCTPFSSIPHASPPSHSSAFPSPKSGKHTPLTCRPRNRDSTLHAMALTIPHCPSFPILNPSPRFWKVWHLYPCGQPPSHQRTLHPLPSQKIPIAGLPSEHCIPATCTATSTSGKRCCSARFPVVPAFSATSFRKSADRGVLLSRHLSFANVFFAPVNAATTVPGKSARSWISSLGLSLQHFAKRDACSLRRMVKRESTPVTVSATSSDPGSNRFRFPLQSSVARVRPSATPTRATTSNASIDPIRRSAPDEERGEGEGSKNPMKYRDCY